MFHPLSSGWLHSKESWLVQSTESEATSLLYLLYRKNVSNGVEHVETNEAPMRLCEGATYKTRGQ